MPRDPKDTSIQAAQRTQRRLGEVEDQKDPIRLRVGAGPAGSEGPEGPEGPPGPPGSEIPIATGTVEVSFPGGSKKSNIATVTHGLGKTPSVVQLTTQRSEAGEVLAEPVLISGSKNSTTFKVRLLGASEFTAVSVPVDWLAC